MRRDDFNMRVIDLMRSVDEKSGPRKDAVLQALAQSLTPRVPWYRRILRRKP